jgi:uncharacterized iron-regulated membrane protein
MAGFLDQPHAHPLRRGLFQVHLWLGLIVGLYLGVVCLSGALLVFRSDLQRTAFPQLLASAHRGELVDIADALDAVVAAYPQHRITGLEAPTRYRQTYLAYVVDGSRFVTVLSDPATGRVLGELPEHSWVAQLQSLHFNLLLGETGRLLHQVATVALSGLIASGAVIWWQGRRRWSRGLSIRAGAWPGVLRNLHSAVGAWTWLALLMILLPASSLVFPRQFRALVAGNTAAVSPSAPAETREPWTARQVIARARELHPREFISRVVLPSEREAMYQVNFAATRPTSLAPSAQVTRYFDRRGVEMAAHPQPARGSRIMAWAIALHVGNFAGNGTRVAWLLLGLLPPVLFVTGFLLWWKRVVRPRRKPTSSAAAPN